MLNLIDRAAVDLRLALIVQHEHVPFQICNMGSELILIRSLADSIEQQLDPARINQPA